MTAPAEGLPGWVTWRQRPFPDANLLLLPGSQPALVDSGFVGHAQDTVDWVRAHTRDLALVVNTHWHSDHVGGQRAAAVRWSRGGCQRRRRRGRQPPRPRLLRSRVPRPARRPLHHRGDPRRRQVLRLGDADWQVVSTPGHTPGHLCAVAARGTPARGRRCALRLRRRLGQPRPRRPRRRRHRPRIPATARRPRPTRPARPHTAPSPPTRTQPSPPHTSSTHAWSRTPTEPSGTAPAGSSPSP